MELSDITKLADLSRLTITDEEGKRLLSDISNILAYVDQVRQAPLNTSESLQVESRNISREDISRVSSDSEDVLAAAPRVTDNFVEVSKVL